jgi:hypothetical protein
MQYIGEFPLDTLLIKVFPDIQSNYTFLEDDGKTFDYERGQVTKIQFECTESDKKTDIIIHPREGAYTGMADSRIYQMEIDLPERPAQILINGNKVRNWQYDSNGKVTFVVKQKNMIEKQLIEIFLNDDD